MNLIYGQKLFCVQFHVVFRFECVENGEIKKNTKLALIIHFMRHLEQPLMLSKLALLIRFDPTNIVHSRRIIVLLLTDSHGELQT